MDSQGKAKVALTFALYQGDQLVRRDTIAQDIVKVGKDPRSHLRVDDELASRMHAVIEVASPADITLIDLGQRAGHAGERPARQQVQGPPERSDPDRLDAHRARERRAGRRRRRRPRRRGCRPPLRPRADRSAACASARGRTGCGRRPTPSRARIRSPRRRRRGEPVRGRQPVRGSCAAAAATPFAAPCARRSSRRLPPRPSSRRRASASSRRSMAARPGSPTRWSRAGPTSAPTRSRSRTCPPSR